MTASIERRPGCQATVATPDTQHNPRTPLPGNPPGIEQTLGYMDRCAGESGHLIVFDRTQGKPWEEQMFRREMRRDGRTITLWGM